MNESLKARRQEIGRVRAESSDKKRARGYFRCRVPTSLGFPRRCAPCEGVYLRSKCIYSTFWVGICLENCIVFILVSPT